MRTKINFYAVAIIAFLVMGNFVALSAMGSASNFNIEDIARGVGFTFIAISYYFAAYVVVQWQKAAARPDERQTQKQESSQHSG